MQHNPSANIIVIMIDWLADWLIILIVYFIALFIQIVLKLACTFPLKGKFPQTTMWIGWVESNFTDPKVKVWADLDNSI